MVGATAAALWDAECEAATDEFPETGKIPSWVAIGAAALAAELLPDSISRFQRLKSARISEATW